MKIISCDCCQRILKEDQFLESSARWGYIGNNSMRDVCIECEKALNAKIDAAQKMGKELYENLMKEAIATVRRERSA